MYYDTKGFLSGLHTLRGMAAASIVIFHFCCLSQEYSPGCLREVVLQFGSGVTLFFYFKLFFTVSLNNTQD